MTDRVKRTCLFAVRSGLPMGSEVDVIDRDKPVTALVVETPFYKRDVK